LPSWRRFHASCWILRSVRPLDFPAPPLFPTLLKQVRFRSPSLDGSSRPEDPHPSKLFHCLRHPSLSKDLLPSFTPAYYHHAPPKLRFEFLLPLILLRADLDLAALFFNESLGRTFCWPRHPPKFERPSSFFFLLQTFSNYQLSPLRISLAYVSLHSPRSRFSSISPSVPPRAGWIPPNVIPLE